MKKGDIVKGRITSIKPFEAFVKIDESFDGLIHISEISERFVRSIEDYLSVGQLVTLEEARGFWSKIAKEHGWYNEPFHVQAWIDEDGTLDDCVSFKGLSRDIVLPKRVDEDD